MTPCPNCGKPVDTLRSRHVGVRDGKVVAFCSAECLAALESKPTAVPSAAPKRQLPTLESGPVIEIIHEPASGVVTSAPDRRDASKPVVSTQSASASGQTEKAKPKKKSKAIEPVEKPAEEAPKKARAQSEPRDEWAKNAEIIKRDSEARVDRPSRGPLVIALIVVLLGAAAFIAYKFVFVSHAPAATPAPRADVPPPKPPEPVPPPKPAEPPLTAALALDKAKAVLTAQLKSVSPSVQRRAAAVLAPLKDPAAIEVLAGALKLETSDLSRLDIAYALARAGDKRGTDALVASLGAPTRDPRQWAAERLVRLAVGEPETAKRPEIARAVDVLASYLDVTQNTISVAGVLAQFGDPRGVKVLEQVRADAKASAENRARATVALGFAGKTDVAPALHDLLAAKDPDAPAALAHLHDAAARPALLEHLALRASRLRAARALRELEPNLDPLPLLPPLVAELASLKDLEQVEAAAVIVVLTGPAAWSAKE